MSGSATRKAVRHLNRVGFSTLALLVVVFGGWASTTELSGAVVAPGSVVLESDVKVVQHPTGGVVAELFVRNGMVVEAGEILIRLDDTGPRSELAILVGRLDELQAHAALLAAERDDLTVLVFSPRLADREGDPVVDALMASTRSTFELRRSSRLGTEATLQQQILQISDEIAGLELQSEAKAHEIELVTSQLTGFQELFAQNLIPRSQLLGLERELIALQGEQGQLIAAIASARGRVSELEIQIASVGRDARTEAAGELQTVGADIAELLQRRIAAEDSLHRIDIRAPQAGIIHGLSVHTVGAVVGAGEPLMTVVPSNDVLLIEARVSPVERDQLYVGQPVAIAFSAFDRATTARVQGSIATIAADTSFDERTGSSYYVVRVTMSEANQIPALDVVPGMQATVFIETEPRTVGSFLIKPLLDQIELAFRER